MESVELTSEALSELEVRPIERSEEGCYQEQMAHHHYLGALPKIGETVCTSRPGAEQWISSSSKQRIDADGVLTGQMVVENRIRQRDQQPVATVPALDARLFADTGTPPPCANMKCDTYP